MSTTSKPKSTSRSYPWSQKNLISFNPFPLYGLSVSDHAVRDELFIFGGLTQGKTINDLYAVEVNTMNITHIMTSGEVPGKRCRHTQLVYENNLVVFGGASEKVEDKLDEGIYILDTESKTWSKPIVNGNAPNGLIGHTATTIGSVLYIFGGQKFGKYYNDLICLDLKALKLQRKKSKFNKFSLGRSRANSVAPCWSVVNTKGEHPPVRSGHTACSYENKIYVFGGTDGHKCYNDMWCYEEKTKTWSNLSCIGFFPVPRERHAGVIVDGVIYIFGGITQKGEELNDLVAFRIANQRWYRFPQMGPSPSARYGLSMSAVNDKIFVFGGDSKQSPKPDSEGDIHILDTAKIKFPPGTLPGMPTMTRRDSSSLRQSIDSSRSEIFQDEPSTIPKILVLAPQSESEENNEQLVSSYQQPPSESRGKMKPNLVIKVPSIGDLKKHMPTDPSLRSTSTDSDQDTDERIKISPPLELRDENASTNIPQAISKIFSVDEDNVSMLDLGKKDHLVMSRPPEIESVNIDIVETKTQLDTINEETEDSENADSEEESEYSSSEEEYSHEEEFQENETPNETEIHVEGSNLRSDSEEVDAQSNADIPAQDNLDDEQPHDHQVSPLQDIREDETLEQSTHVTSHIVSPSTLDRPGIGRVKHLSLPGNLENYSLSKRGEHDYDVSLLMNRLTIQSPLVPSVSTPDKESFMSFPESGTSSPELNVDDSRVDEKEEHVMELKKYDQDIEEYKRRETWLNAELDLAKKLGYVVDLSYSDDVDLEVMMTNFGEPGSEKYRVMQSIVNMKQELAKAKEVIKTQELVASEKVMAAEKERTAALEEAALYKSKLDEFESSHKGKHDEFESPGLETSSQESEKIKKLESQLAQVLKENKLLSNQLLRYYKKTEKERTKAQSYQERENFENVRTETSNESREQVLPELEKLRARVVNSEAQLEDSNNRLSKMDSELQKHKEDSRVQVSHLKESLERYHIIFEQINTSINVTNERHDRLEKLLKKLRNKKIKYEAEVAELKVELNIKQGEVAQVEDKIKEMEKLLENIQDEGRILRLMMQEGIKELLNINIGGNKEGNIWQTMRVKQLEEELKQLKSLQDENGV
ncbi:12455_t:CDS:2 [Acaulospora morrowiae]|uniref:12455_t:CDS:1 n=1 Tax=Acaulospora morrowiae TaxID=94023 RepID=A0A9N9ADS0_9GLOM|nr:12455_t:CDS:2 [Acaulospora morrowiae]